jgi:NAD(P)-dependent dehydrogenase (short-subunit alcohol dehydrogenase family)
VQIDGTSALVTGGASGLGLATARRIVEHGGRVVIADISEQQGAKALAELGDAARFVAADVTDEVSVAASKAGVHGMTLVAARDLASRQIRVNTIAPGAIRMAPR